MTSPAKATTIDDYIARFPPPIQAILEQVRQTVRAAAPDAQETIAYDMPTFTLQGNLVYFAANKRHIGLYPRTASMDRLKPALTPYEGTKSSLHFAYDKPIPYDLITEVVKIRVEEQQAQAAAKGQKPG